MSKIEQEEKVYFPGLNALRFFAALAVIVSHIELLKMSFGFKNCWENPIIFNLGSLGVYFFFVLSGFLITFLLLKEKDKFNRISIKKFYLRRILRIWPLYYLICILGFFMLPHFENIHIPYLQKAFLENYYSNLLLYLLILPNVAFSFFPAVPHIGQLWSIGVEEQFYIVWPWLISKSKNVLKSLFFVVTAIILIKILVLFLGVFFLTANWYQPLKLFLAMSKFECMTVGGIGAYYLYVRKETLLKFAGSSWVFNIAILSIPVLILFTPQQFQDGIHIPFSFIFLTIILHVILSRNLWLNLESRAFSYLGKISYGIYMYHLLVIPIVLYIYRSNNLNFGETGFNLFVYASTIVITIMFAGISYFLFEERFIRLKKKFSFIKSGQ